MGFLQSCSLELPMLLQRLAISDMAMEDMLAMGATGMERDLLKLKPMPSQDIPEDMEVMDMEDMAVMDVDTMARGKPMLNQDTPEAMVMVVMEAMDVDTMARGKPRLNQDTPEAMVMVVMEAMDVDTMVRGKLML